MKIFPITIHSIVKNEDQFIYYALKSVLPYVSKALIVDTGSTDQTWEIIKKLKDEFKNSLEAKQIQIKSKEEISNLRQSLIEQTQTPFFLLLDGDEIWPKSELLNLLNLTKDFPKEKIAIVNETRNCVGDIYHYLPENFGKYKLLGKTGHLNIRLMKTLPYKVKGIYPDEGYYLDNKLINNLDNKLIYSPSWYLHTTHIKRSSNSQKPFGRRIQTISKGIDFTKLELPKILFEKPNSSILNKRSDLFEIKAMLYDLIRNTIN